MTQRGMAMMYDRYGGMVLAVALRIVGNRELAEEIMQDAFLRCWNGVETFERGRGPVAACLVGIARNRSIDMLRSRFLKTSQCERTSINDIDPGGGMPDPSDGAELVLTRQAVIVVSAPEAFARGSSCGVSEEPAGGLPRPTGPSMLGASYDETWKAGAIRPLDTRSGCGCFSTDRIVARLPQSLPSSG